MKRVLTAAILIPIVVLALFKAPLWLFTLLVFGVAVLTAHEYFGIMKAQGYRPMAVAGYMFLALSFTIFYTTGDLLSRITPQGPLGEFITMMFFAGLPLLTILAPLLFLLLGLAHDPLSQALPSAAMSYLVLPYVAFTLGMLVIFQPLANGPLYVLLLMLLVWCGDIAAYYVGRAWGKHKLAPRISPGKTWEGAIASVLGAVVVALLLFRFINPIANTLRAVHLLSAPSSVFYTSIPNTRTAFSIAPGWLVALFAVCVNVAAQFGDLVESALKRGAGVKDSGTLLPGHGGVLDRIDALLFALPVGLIFYIAGMSRYFSASS